MNRDVVVMAQRADAAAGPTVAVGRRFSRPIEHHGDRVIGHVTSQGAHEVDNIRVGDPSRVAELVLLHTKARVISSLPMNEKLEAVANDVDDNLGNDRADNLLARLGGSARAVPSLRQIPAQHHETISIRDGERLHLFGAELVEFGFEMAHHNQARHRQVNELGAGDG